MRRFFVFSVDLLCVVLVVVAVCWALFFCLNCFNLAIYEYKL